MEFFCVQKSITLKLPHKECVLHAPDSEALASKQIPLKNIYCGNVYWEIAHARSIGGDSAAIALPLNDALQRLMPPVLRPWSIGNDLIAQVREIVRRRSPDRQGKPLRFVLVNGVGTMIGDTLIGAAAVEIAIRRVRNALGPVEVHAGLGWNARPGTENIFQRCPVISVVHHHALTVEQLRGFDAYWDFSELLAMEGYDTLPLIDFYLNSLGIDHASVASAEKIPPLRLPPAIVADAKAMLDPCRGRPVLLIQGQASTPLRSMPDIFMAELIGDVLRETDTCVLLTQPSPVGMRIEDEERAIRLDAWCQGSTDRYLALVSQIDMLISIDSLAIHAAAAAKIPGVAIFTTLDPHLRLAYAPTLTGLLIPGATGLKTWGKHKADANWPDEQAEYDKAWATMDKSVILDALKFASQTATLGALAISDDSLPADENVHNCPTEQDNLILHSESQGLSMTPQKQVLHIGCGHYDPRKLPTYFRTEAWRELRLDIDPRAQPDIVADMRDLSQLADGQVDAIYSSHNVEHLYPHEVPVALKEFRRVIKPEGFALITLPDLQEVARLVADGRLDDPAYISPAGPIAPHDILYGHRPSMEKGNLFMAHRTGFTAKTLAQALVSAGFAMITVQRNPALFNLWAIAFVNTPSDEQLKEAQSEMFPLPVQ
jgi:SAM-dependent methyltransferase